MIEMKFTNVKLWRNDDKGFPIYTISISNKTESGDYENMYIECRVPKNTPKISNGTKIDCEGFPSCRSWVDNKGNKKYVPVFVLKNIIFSETDEEIADKVSNFTQERFDGFQEADDFSIPF